MKLKELESRLQELEGFRNPRIELEQYETRPHLAARILFTIEQSYGDISNKIVADLGCGPGRLTIGAALLGADFSFGFDVDFSVLDIFRQNAENAEIQNIESVLMDVTSLTNSKNSEKSEKSEKSKFSGFFDTVLLNPPFGTKNNKGIDVQFLQAGLLLSNHAVYSFHKSATREYLLKKAKEWNVEMNVVAELKFDIPQSYSRHKLASVDVEVDLLRTVHRTKRKNE